MKIIELYGFSASGKSYKANQLVIEEKLNSLFLQITKKKKLHRILKKISFFNNIEIRDIIFVVKIFRLIKFNTFNYKIKSLFGFVYVISFIRYFIKKKDSIVIDHGIFQCIFGCFLYSKNKNLENNIGILLKEYLKILFENIDHKIIGIEPDLNMVENRLIKDNNHIKLKFLKKNKNKIIDTYSRISFILKNYIKNNFVILSK